VEANYGILSLVPAFIVIGLALWTKKTLLPLMIGTFIGVIILNGFNPLTALPMLVAFYKKLLREEQGQSELSST